VETEHQVSLRRHIAANYASQIYVAGVGILVTPLYLRAMGVESYGLIGFFAALQVWFLLLDAGLSPAVAREIARYVGGAPDAMPTRQLLRKVELLFLALAAVGTAALALCAEAIAVHWLRVQSLAVDDVVTSVRWMAFTVGLRLLASLYRAVVTGYERLGWLSAFNAIAASARAFAALPALAWLGATPQVYFGVQLVVAVIEVAVLAHVAHKLVRQAHRPTQEGEVRLRQLGRFSGSVAITTLLNVCLGQSDRLLLSTLLSLPDYATFMLATLAASAISLASGPLGSVFMPRLARLASTEDPQALLDTYRLTLRLMAAVVFPAALTMAWQAQSLVWAWTGNQAVAVQAAPILALYAIGNALAAIAMPPYLLQFALGRLRWHVLGSLVFIGLLIPGQWILTVHHGAHGAGAFWIAVNLAWLLAWLPWVHRRLLPGVRWAPALHDVLRIVAVSTFCSAVPGWWLHAHPIDHRIGATVALALSWASTFAMAGLCLPEVRARLPRPFRLASRP
jgi:O-antigen/teichoic acid export membrane protein